MNYNSSCLIVAGEKSGEDHALTFLPELMKRNPNCKFYGVGGERLKEQGVELLYELEEFSGIGISEIITKVPFYFKAMNSLMTEVVRRKTHHAILIDFQTFNLKIAKKLKKHNVKVLYYVAPQAWVWKAWRAKVLEKCVHTLFTILPFEKKWFLERGVSKVKGVLHPLMIEYKNELALIPNRTLSPKRRILLLPGSRSVEVKTLLPIFKQALRLLDEEGISYEVGIVKVPHLKDEYYDLFKDIENSWHSDDLVSAMKWADMAVAASGTVTLTTGLFSLPTVVVYKLSALSEFIFSNLVSYTGYVSLTNIIHNHEVFPEFTQYQCDRYNISKSLKRWINNKDFYDDTVALLNTTKNKLSGDDFDLVDYMDQVLKDKKA